MTSRVTFAPQDVQKMCKQAERDQESKQLVLLMDRVKRQIAEHQNPGIKMDVAKKSTKAIRDSGLLRLPNRSVPLER